MISTPTTSKTALQMGVIFGVSLSALMFALILTTLSRFIPTPIFFFGLPALAFFLAGLFASKRTGKVSTGTLAGLLSGAIMIIMLMALLFILALTVEHGAFVQGAMNSSVDPQYAQQDAWLGLVIIAIIFLCMMAGIGSGFGALGGVIGKKMLPLAQQSYVPYPPASLPMQASHEFSSPPPPPQQHVYRLLPMWRVFYAVVFPLINVIVGFSLILQNQNFFGNSVFSLFMKCFIVLAVSYNIYYGIRMSMARLVTSPTGVMYYGVGFRIYAPWHQITGIDKVRKSLMYITGLTFRTPVVQAISANQAIQEQSSVLEISRWRRPFYRQYIKFIPLTWFVGNLQNSTLGGDIRWSAPQLFGGISSVS